MLSSMFFYSRLQLHLLDTTRSRFPRHQSYLSTHHDKESRNVTQRKDPLRLNRDGYSIVLKFKYRFAVFSLNISFLDAGYCTPSFTTLHVQTSPSLPRRGYPLPHLLSFVPCAAMHHIVYMNYHRCCPCETSCWSCRVGPGWLWIYTVEFRWLADSELDS
ncbi:hypothetical protein BDQ12DRAFT_118509 [Crucibulum laeve]|uniref:Uncharacterized protein n=1 Tax=Crucibulum laeve TaxID=68775 RepID=A0A5C3LG17_9AGAR|nr:hypothetical protein BDQ12DRAFT_118509 [Crucibulum laeve]